MAYRIERAKTGRSSCRHCGLTIEKDAQRFGKDGQISRWFHLHCAAEGAPRAFKPFAEQAAALLAAEPPPEAPEPGERKPRDPAAEAMIAENPEDAEARAVFADYLQGIGDPWGEVIALEKAGKNKDAKKLRNDKAAELYGGLAAKFFDWDEQGFVTRVTLEAKKTAQLKEQYERLRELPLACALPYLGLPLPPDAALIEAINAKQPPALRAMFFHYSEAVDELALPKLEELSFFVPQDPVAAPKFFSGEAVPRLRVLSMYSNSNPLPPEFLDAMLGGALMQQLEQLRLFQGALDDAGTSRVLAHADNLQSIKKLGLDAPKRRLGEIAKAFRGNWKRDY